MPISLIVCTPEQAAVVAAELVVGTVARILPHRTPEVGAATGNTPIPTYREMIAAATRQGVDLSRVRTWNLDEYRGLSPGHPLSYRTYMATHLHDRVGTPPEFRCFPDLDDPAAYDLRIARDTTASGIDIGLLGIGRTGHIGFAEPGCDEDGGTFLSELHQTTRQDAVREFGSLDLVPTHAVSMGVGTIRKYWSRVILMAFGLGKADPVWGMLQGPIGNHCPASLLRRHRDVTVLLDPPAASKLTMKLLQATQC